MFLRQLKPTRLCSILGKVQAEGKGKQWLPSSQCLGACIWGIVSSVGLPSARGDYKEERVQQRNVEVVWGQRCKCRGRGEEIGLAQVEDERTKGDLTADFSSLKEGI